MTDDELSTWLILRFGTLDKALKSLNSDTLWEKRAGPFAEFNDEEMELLEFYRMKQLTRKLQ